MNEQLNLFTNNDVKKESSELDKASNKSYKEGLDKETVKKLADELGTSETIVENGLAMNKIMIDSLANDIKENAKLYYNKGKANLSDKDFDFKVSELKRMCPDHEVLKTVGYCGEQGKEEHEYGLVGSLDKETDWASLKNAYGDDSIVTPKLDGSSVTMYYENGKLQRILSRGNGNNGKTKPILHKIVPNEIPYDKPIAIRGELVMSKRVFENKYKTQGYVSPRNMATGLMHRNQLSADELGDIEIVCYKIHGSVGQPNASKVGSMALLRDWGFNVCPYKGLGELVNEESWNVWRDGMDYPCDGLVITKDEIFVADNGYFIYTEIAYKFEDEESEGEVDHVDWQFSDRNNMIPVVKLVGDGVFLDGARIKSITGFNAKFVVDNNLGKGSMIKLKRKNEVIPIISEVTKGTKAELPTECPACKTKLDRNGVHLSCTNPDCEHLKEKRLMSYIRGFVDDYDIKGIGDGMIGSIIKALNIKTMKELIEKLHITSTDEIKVILEGTGGFGYSKVNLALKLIAEMRKQPINKANVLSIMVQGLGYVGAKRIIDTAPTLDDTDMASIPRMAGKVKDIIKLKKAELVETLEVMNSIL